MGDMTLQDFDGELVKRGFDAFDPDSRKRYINWGYRRIARKSRWFWEQTSNTFDLAVGALGITVSRDYVAGTITNFKSLVNVYLRTPITHKLRPLSDEEFFEKWFALDLSLTQGRGTPTGYYLWENLLYILPPPDRAAKVEVHWKQQVTALNGAADKPITPPDLDEAILTASLARAHRRANEIALSQQAEAELEIIFEEMSSDEAFQEEEQLTRVSPDDQWI